MDCCNFSSHLQALLGLLAFVFLFIFFGRRNRLGTKKIVPEVPGAWPIIGHLHQLISGEDMPFARTLGALADKYGPVFTLRIGMYPYLVVSSCEAAKDCFTTHDKDFAARPSSLFNEHLSYKDAVLSICSYGPYYSHVRKLVLQHALSSTMLEKMKNIRISEVEIGIKELYSCSPSIPAAKVNISKWLEQLTLNIIVKTVCGKRYNRIDEDEEAQRLKKAFKEILYVTSEINLYDAIPFPLFKYLDFQGHIKFSKRVHKILDSILQGWLDDHMTKNNKSVNKDNHQDLIDAMLTVTDVNEFKAYGYSQATVIKATALNMILDGADAIYVHLTWLMSLLLNNRHVIKQAQEEIDVKIGKERWVEDTDIQNLVYIQAIVKETLRLYPSAPLLITHEAVNDCKVVGYDIPKGTRLFVNAWKIQRDPEVWAEPEKFMPERFLTSDVDARGHHFELIPFGSGRRSCPGMNFTTLVTHLVVTRLLQGFDFNTVSNAQIDMKEGLGLSMPMVNQVEVLITPRLPSTFYEL